MRADKKQTTPKTKTKKLKVNKVTIKDLDTRKSEQVKGGVPKIPEAPFSVRC
jgi:hypothetical protein